MKSIETFYATVEIKSRLPEADYMNGTYIYVKDVKVWPVDENVGKDIASLVNIGDEFSVSTPGGAFWGKVVSIEVQDGPDTILHLQDCNYNGLADTFANGLFALGVYYAELPNFLMETSSCDWPVGYSQYEDVRQLTSGLFGQPEEKRQVMRKIFACLHEAGILETA